MATETWNAEGIHYQTKTRFTPAGYDIKGFNEQGFDRYGYDKDGFNERNLDKYGNRRDSGLMGYETRVLINIAHCKGEPFRKTDVIPGFYRDGDKASREWHFDHKQAFEDLVYKGVIIKSGRRWTLVKRAWLYCEELLSDESSAENSNASE